MLQCFKDNIQEFDNKNILGRHAGGKQVLAVYECLFQGKKVAIKIYKPIITHLMIHSLAINYIMNHFEAFNEPLSGQNISLSFPATIALGQPFSSNFIRPISILIQEWIGDSEEIHKVFPREHVNMIRSIIRKLTIHWGFLVDIMSKNWLVTSNKHKLVYVDLILFNPTGLILEKIKNWANELDYDN